MGPDYGAAKPPKDGQCWARVGKTRGAHVSDTFQCRNTSRPGKLTCRYHDHVEIDAQAESSGGYSGRVIGPSGKPVSVFIPTKD